MIWPRFYPHLQLCKQFSEFGPLSVSFGAWCLLNPDLCLMLQTLVLCDAIFYPMCKMSRTFPCHKYNSTSLVTHNTTMSTQIVCNQSCHALSWKYGNSECLNISPTIYIIWPPLREIFDVKTAIKTNKSFEHKHVHA